MREYPRNPEHPSWKETMIWAALSGAISGLSIISPIFLGIGVVITTVGAVRVNRFESSNRVRGLAEAIQDNLKAN